MKIAYVIAVRDSMGSSSFLVRSESPIIKIELLKSQTTISSERKRSKNAISTIPISLAFAKEFISFADKL